MKTQEKKSVKILKGGSLSSTYLIEKGNLKFVRKDVSLNENREYGFYRWYSQLKKLQRLGKLFPEIFPKILSYGIKKNDAYLDMEYIENSVNGFEFLQSNPSKSEVDVFLKVLIETMEKLHSNKMESFKEALSLYVYEEIERPLKFCISNDKSLKKFSEYESIFLNDLETIPILSRMQEIYDFIEKYHHNPQECYTHGNLTLENILWVQKEEKMIFIDLYEENVTDTIYNEYSQLLQSSNSNYEAYNELCADIKGNKVYLKVEKTPAMEYFNNKFLKWVKQKLSPEEIKITRLYEISQFTRMLPFKMHVSKEKMIFFYSLASHLLDKLLGEEKYNGD